MEWHGEVGLEYGDGVERIALDNNKRVEGNILYVGRGMGL